MMNVARTGGAFAAPLPDRLMLAGMRV